MRLRENILYNKGIETYFLDHTLFNLDSVYDDIYKMNYITKEHVDKDSILHTIRFHFSEHNMMRYFGDRANLSCEQTRDGYISMIQYMQGNCVGLFWKNKSIRNISITICDGQTCGRSNPFIAS